MRRGIILTIVALCLPAAATVEGGHGRSGFRYPRVYGPTGRPYGPTQAHYQYQRRYGRPWHGQGGLTAHRHAGHHFGGHTFARRYGSAVYGGYVPGSLTPGYGYGYGVVAPGYVIAPPVVGYVPVAPAPVVPVVPFNGPDPFDNDVLRGAMEENRHRWGEPLKIKPEPPPPVKIDKPSPPEALARSIRLQQHGDAWLKKSEYQQAYERYRRAAAAAPERAAPRFRMAYVMAASGRFSLAVQQIKRGLELDPDWPSTGRSLDEVFGEDRRLGVLSLIQEVAAWVREDIRDPDRLFLLGVLLHFDDDSQAVPFFENALRLAGEGEHLHAFLRSKRELGQKRDGELHPKAGEPGPQVEDRKPEVGDEPDPVDVDDLPVPPLPAPFDQSAPPKPPLPTAPAGDPKTDVQEGPAIPNGP